MEKILEKLERILKELPQPLIEPVYYPNIGENVLGCMARLVNNLSDLAEKLAKLIKEEALFDENPLIIVYPNHREASGVVVFYKGQRVYEKWVMSFELNFGERQEQRREQNNRRSDMHYNGYYDEAPYGMSPEEIDFLYGPPWERGW